MIKTFSILLAALLFATNASAGPASQESVEELLTITKAEALLDSVYANLEQMMRQGISQRLAGRSVTSQQRRILDAVPAKFVQIFREEYSWAKLKPVYAQLYRDTFAQEEVEGIIAFYKTPTGQALLNKMPALMQRSMALSQAQLQTLIPRMQAAIEEALADAKVGTEL